MSVAHDPFPPAEGGCQCGAVRYRVGAPPQGVDLCHCAQCRRQSGSAFIPWLVMRTEDFAWIAGKPARHESSPGSHRLFCRDCGTPLAMTWAAEPHLVDVTLGSLDDSSRFVPTAESWTSSRLPWARLVHRMVDHPEDSPSE